MTDPHATANGGAVNGRLPLLDNMGQLVSQGQPT
jgi:hypothetical protein